MNSIKNILKTHKIVPKKHLGQNFLKANLICKDIVAYLEIKNDDVVLEIGPGLGALTISMSKLAKKIFAVEKDIDLVNILRIKLLASSLSNTELINADILKIDFKSIYHKAKQPLILVGNLPYNISSQILIKTIQNRKIFNKALFMLQKEVVDRICSNPGSKNYGRLSVLLQYYADLDPIFVVKPSMFFPKPKVESSLVSIVFSDKLKFIAKNEVLLFSIVKAAFSKRRKTLKNALSKSHLNIDSKLCKIVMSKANIDPTRRAETLSVKEFVILSNCFNEILN